MIFLWKQISLYALGRLKWILDIVWPLNQHFNLKNQRNWRTTFFMLRFLIGIICILLHRPKKLTLPLWHKIRSGTRTYLLIYIDHLVKLRKKILKIWPQKLKSAVRRIRWSAAHILESSDRKKHWQSNYSRCEKNCCYKSS